MAVRKEEEGRREKEGEVEEVNRKVTETAREEEDEQ